tara:strand:- start:1070 stop:1759 length:690 start_codon:yes stop_codon:yes gene_type:complete
MKVVILAGGFGTRLSEYTRTIPKPMISICGKPIITYIIKHYEKFGFREFIIATGYKKNIINQYFKKHRTNSNIKTIYTGLKTMTGGRIKRLKSLIGGETFLMTYGDGISNPNLSKLIKLHFKNKNIATLTAVRPPARFGAIKLNLNKVTYFKEKSHLDTGWINGGFFVFSPEIFKYLKNDNTILERTPMQVISKKKKLGAYKHSGFWQCMDTLRDKEILEKLIKKNKNL